MTSSTDSPSPADPYNLSRFLEAQETSFEQALRQIKSGHKTTHWMWYIFPQFEGLSLSSTSKFYAIKSRDEATAYLAHPVLGSRLIECAEAALAVEEKSALDIFGHPDDAKLKSCATLFASVSSPGSVFERLLEHYYEGERDADTLELLEKNNGSEPSA
jgi:uncharacterized protein (DUF1810 family)